MKIQILSDTHNNAYTFDKEAELIVHAGDFSNSLKGCIEFVNKCNAEGKKHVFVLGNHDYYNSDIVTVLDFFKQNPGYNLLTYDNSIEIEGYTFVGGTLFTNFRANRLMYDNPLQFTSNKQIARHGIYDFLAIKNRNRILVPDDYVTLFNMHYNNIMKYKKQNKVVVVTHFPPHLACLDPYWGVHPTASSLNPYFINDLDVKGFKLWISGHTHTAVDTTVDGCRLIVNPLGYPDEHDVNGYNKKLILDLKKIYK